MNENKHLRTVKPKRMSIFTNKPKRKLVRLTTLETPPQQFENSNFQPLENENPQKNQKAVANIKKTLLGFAIEENQEKKAQPNRFSSSYVKEFLEKTDSESRRIPITIARRLDLVEQIYDSGSENDFKSDNEN